MDALDHVKGNFQNKSNDNVRVRHVLLQSMCIRVKPASMFNGSCKGRDAFEKGESNLGVVGLDAWDMLDA